MWLVLFDIDGTLLSSGGCGRAATQLALHEVFGTTGAVEEVNFAGKTDWQILIESLTTVGVSMEEIQRRIAQYNRAVTQHLSHIIADFPVKACPGVPDLVAELRTNPAVVMGLVTGNMSGLVPVKLRAAGYNPADFVIGAFGSEGWERAMLPPLALDRAQAHANVVFAPDEIVIIGDTPGDILCAASIGARTMAVATGPYSVDELRVHQPDYAFDTLADTGAVLAAILQNGA